VVSVYAVKMSIKLSMKYKQGSCRSGSRKKKSIKAAAMQKCRIDREDVVKEICVSSSGRGRNVGIGRRSGGENGEENWVVGRDLCATAGHACRVLVLVVQLPSYRTPGFSPLLFLKPSSCKVGFSRGSVRYFILPFC
jgi:hypothetical protein